MNRRSPARPAADRNADIVLGAAVIAMGLLAGLFYAFDVAAMPALTAADDGTLVDAMQQKIDKIESPTFFVTSRRSGSLNDDLKEAGDPARIENLAAVRDDFVTPWVAWTSSARWHRRRPSAAWPGRSSCADAWGERGSHNDRCLLKSDH